MEPPQTSNVTQPTEQQPPQQTQSPSSSSSSLPPSSLPSTSPSLPSSSNPNPTPKPLIPQSQPQQQQSSIQNSQTRQSFNRPWQQPSHFSHFSSHLSSSIPPHSSTSSSPSPVPPFSSPSIRSITPPPAQRGGMAIGVPAHHPSSPPPPSFSSLSLPSFGQQFGGLSRNSGSVPESMASSSTSQVKQPIQGAQGTGMVGSLGLSSTMRPGGVPVHHQLRPGQASLRPQTSPSTQSPASQSFQGHGMLRVSSLGSPSLPSPNTSQSPQSHNQPWLSSGSQGKPPLPPPSLRSQLSPQSLQQRSHIPQQQQHTIATTQQTSAVQQPSSSHQPQEHYGQQFPPSKIQQSLPHQQQIARGQGLGSQKPSFHAFGEVHLGPPSKMGYAETNESCNRILSKRSIQELVTQIDPSEKLDSEVEDILVDIADDFVESITTFGCSLAKHRKSTTLEAKDILLHLERNWNMTLPGFSGDEIKIYKKQVSSDIHRERLAAIKKSTVATETASIKSSGGQVGGNTKSHLAKAPANSIGSPNPKIREAA